MEPRAPDLQPTEPPFNSTLLYSLYLEGSLMLQCYSGEKQRFLPPLCHREPCAFDFGQEGERTPKAILLQRSFCAPAFAATSRHFLRYHTGSKTVCWGQGSYSQPQKRSFRAPVASGNKPHSTRARLRLKRIGDSLSNCGALALLIIQQPRSSAVAATFPDR